MSGMTVKSNVKERLAECHTKLDLTVPKSLLKAAYYVAKEIAKTCAGMFKNYTGDLAGSFMAGVRGAVIGEHTYSAGAYSNKPYARIQEEGGTIVSSRGQGKMLAIPLNRESAALWPREWPKGKLHFYESKNGNKLLADAAGNNQYLLRDSVKIEPTYYLQKSAEGARQKVKEMVGADVIMAVKP